MTLTRYDHIVEAAKRASSASTRVSLSRSANKNSTQDLDYLTRQMYSDLVEVNSASQQNTRLEEIARKVQLERQVITSLLSSALSDAGISGESAIQLELKEDSVTVSHHPKSSQLNYLFAQNIRLTEQLIRLQKHIRVVQMGLIAASAYGEWKQKTDLAQVKNLMSASMQQLTNIQGAQFQNGKLTFALDGQADRQKQFNRRFSFA